MSTENQNKPSFPPSLEPSSNEFVNSTRVRLLTARAPAAIAVIQLAGPQSNVLIDLFWKPASGDRSVAINAIRYGSWIARGVDLLQPEDNQASEDVVLCWTKEDCVEVHCHGGPVAANRIISDLIRRGAVEEDGSAFSKAMTSITDTKRWTEEAWQDLPLATTELTTAILLNQATGLLDQAMTKILEQIALGDTGGALKALDQLELRSTYGTRLLDGWRVAIVGPPNAGKSSFLNRILGYTRAIVHHKPGTTRDVLRERASIMGWPVEFIDTAGLRETDCGVEAEGVRRALEVLGDSDLILLLVEPNEGVVAMHQQILDDYHAKVLVVVTKADLFMSKSETATVQAALNRLLPVVAISSSMNLGVDELLQEIIARVIPYQILNSQAVPFRKQQVRAIQELKAKIQI